MKNLSALIYTYPIEKQLLPSDAPAAPVSTSPSSPPAPSHSPPSPQSHSPPHPTTPPSPSQDEPPSPSSYRVTSYSAGSTRSAFDYLLASEGRSPALIVIRRLFLDLSFILAVLGLVRMGWRRSGVRRREIAVALRVLWRAVVGTPAPRALVSRGV